MTDQTASTSAAAEAGAFVRPPYDRTTLFLHWATLALVLGQFVTALSIDHVEPALARALLTVHRSTGVTLWVVVAFRLGWRFTGMKLPPFPPSMKPWHIAGVHLSEYGLYGLLLSQPITGLADTALRGRAFDLFLWTVPALAERNRPLAKLAHSLHEAGAYLLVAVVTVHASAALFHHFVRKDGILRSMAPWIGGPAPHPVAETADWPEKLEA